MPFHIRKNPVGRVEDQTTFHWKKTTTHYFGTWRDEYGNVLAASFGYIPDPGEPFIQDHVWAQRGYGILFYMLMSKLTKSILVPSDCLSKDAERFWNRDENKHGIKWDLARWNRLTNFAPIPKFIEGDTWTTLDLRNKVWGEDPIMP